MSFKVIAIEACDCLAWLLESERVCLPARARPPACAASEAKEGERWCGTQTATK